MIKRILILLVVAACAQCATMGQSASSLSDNGSRGFLLKTVKIGGKQINYTLYVPQTYDSAKPMPLIVFLNGYGECGTDGLKPIVTGLPQAINRNHEKWDKFITLIPQKQEYDTYWEEAEINTLLKEINVTKRAYNIDESRMYLTGLSQGGHGTYYIAAMFPKMFAAIAPICGWADEDIAPKIKDIPTWIFHGELDDDFEAFVQNSYNMDGWLKELGAREEKLTIIPGVAHACWDIVYQNHPLDEWFLAHRLEKGENK